VKQKKVSVLPMVPAGRALHEFLLYDADAEKLRKAALKLRFPDGNYS
jgi:acetolactate synthase-1/2/3 large subunit